MSNPIEHAFLFPGINEHDYLVARNHVLRRWRDDPDAYLSVGRARVLVVRPKFRALVHCAHRFLTTTGLINFGVGFATNYLDDVDRERLGRDARRRGGGRRRISGAAVRRASFWRSGTR